MHWRRKWQPTPVFLPGKSGGAWWAAIYGSHRVRHDWSDLAGAAVYHKKKKSVTPRSCFGEYQNQKFVNDSWSLLSGSISNLFLDSVAQYWENSTLCWEVFVNNKSLERSLESPLDCQEIKPVNPEGNQPWIFIGKTDAAAEASINTLATWCKELTHWKRLWCWERLKSGGEGNNRGQDSRIASLTQWTWVWASSRRWWLTRKPGVLQSMGLQRVRHLSDWTTMSGCPMVIVYTRMTGPATHLSLASELSHHQTSSCRKCTVLVELSIKGGRGGRIWDPSELIRLFWKFELRGK